MSCKIIWKEWKKQACQHLKSQWAFSVCVCVCVFGSIWFDRTDWTLRNAQRQQTSTKRFSFSRIFELSSMRDGLTHGMIYIEIHLLPKVICLQWNMRQCVFFLLQCPPHIYISTVWMGSKEAVDSLLFFIYLQRSVKWFWNSSIAGWIVNFQPK